MKAIIWSVQDIAKIIKARQENEFDANFGVSGDRGNGKSHLCSKIFYRLKKFNPWKHQVYSSTDVKRLLMKEFKGKCFDDEAINSGYKRNFQDKGQQELIKILTNYRDNFNVHGSAIPNFFSLDKDLRDLIFLHIHVLERGMAVVHLPIQNRLYTQDRWDAKNNAKIEQTWGNRIKKNINFKVPYHRLSTFAGYLYYSDITQVQSTLYKEIKRVKRANEYEDLNEDKEQTFFEKLFIQVLSKKLTQEGLMQICSMEGKKYSSVAQNINRLLRDRQEEGRLGDYLLDKNKKNINVSGQINDLVSHSSPSSA